MCEVFQAFVSSINIFSNGWAHMGLDARKPVFGCGSAKTDQCLCYSLFGSFIIEPRRVISNNVAF